MSGQTFYFYNGTHHHYYFPLKPKKGGRMRPKLSEIEWDEGRGVQELIAWGTEPVKALVTSIQNEYETDGEMDKNLVLTLSYLIEDKLNEMDSTIERFVTEMKKER